MTLPRKLLSPVMLAVFAPAVAGCGQEPAAEEQPADSGGVESKPELEAATDHYKDYEVGEAGQIVADTGTFTDAVIGGDVERAKETYAPARVRW